MPVPVGDIAGWHQVFADDFHTNVPVGGFSGCSVGPSLMTSNCRGLPASVAAKWWAYPDGWSDSTNGVYEPSQTLSISGGLLNIHLHTVNGIHMVAAPEPKIPGGVGGNGLLYGRYEVRFRADAVPGYKTAFLLWPDSGIWPADGEIDFPEGDLNSPFLAFMHHMNGTSGTLDVDTYPTSDTYTAWHTAVIEWTPKHCSFSLDGNVIGVSTSNIPSTSMHWVLQAQTALDGTGPTATAAGDVQVAWVAVYVPG